MSVFIKKSSEVIDTIPVSRCFSGLITKVLNNTAVSGYKGGTLLRQRCRQDF